MQELIRKVILLMSFNSGTIHGSCQWSSPYTDLLHKSHIDCHEKCILMGENSKLSIRIVTNSGVNHVF